MSDSQHVTGRVSARRALRLALVCALVAIPGAASAEWQPGTFMAKALARVMAAGRLLSEKTPYGWDRDICLMGAFLKPKDSIGFGRTLQAGESYVFVAGGDDDVKDLDLFVVDSEGNRVATDSKADATPMVEFSPEKTGQYAVRIRLFGASRASFCALGVFRKNGFDVPVDSLSTAAAKLIAACGKISEKAKGARFHQEPNQWALFGAIMKQGETQTVTNLAPEDANHAFICMGDSNAKNLDLFLLDGSQQSLKEDTDTDANPLVLFATKKGQSYGLRFKNTESSAAALVMTAILDIGVSD